MKTNQTNKTALLFFLSVITLAPVHCLAFEFDGALKGVKITDAAGANQPPTAVINYTQNGDTFTFDASGSSDPDGSIVEYKWDFGDGITGQGLNTSHSFSISGSHPVNLTVVDNNGGVGLAQVNIVSRICGSVPSISQKISSTVYKLGNFANLYYQGTTYHGHSIDVCKIEIALKQYEGIISEKNFYVEIYTADSKGNLGLKKGISLPVSGKNISPDCSMVPFDFDSFVQLADNDVIVIHMDGGLDSRNYAGVCYKSFQNLWQSGELGTWNQDLTLRQIRTDGSDLTFNLYTME